MVTMILLILIFFFLSLSGSVLWFSIMLSITIMIPFFRLAIRSHRSRKNPFSSRKRRRYRKSQSPASPGSKIVTPAAKGVDPASIVIPALHALEGAVDSQPRAALPLQDGGRAPYTHSQDALSQRLGKAEEAQRRLASCTRILPVSAHEAGNPSQGERYHTYQFEVTRILAYYGGSHHVLSEEFKDSIEYMRATIPHIRSGSDYENRDDYKRFEQMEEAVGKLLGIHDAW